MFKRLFGLAGRPDKAAIDKLYGQIVAAARQPALYSLWQVPDSPIGRFEMMSLHVFLLLYRLRGETEARAIAQEITDEFFKDIDHSIRELGIGDMGVPRRMKKLARMFYGRVAAYGEALDASDKAALAVALARNVRPQEGEWPQAEQLAAYVLAVRDALAEQPSARILAGEADYPEPAPVSPSADRAA